MKDRGREMNTDFDKIARELFDLVGSEENILFVENCMTRLRLRLKDTKKVDVGILKKNRKCTWSCRDKGTISNYSH